MENDIFSNINTALRSLPDEIHLITWAILMALYAHLLYGSFLERKKIKTHARIYLMIRGFLMLSYLCFKAVDIHYGMFDLFLPIYIFFYTDGLIIVKGYSFHRCEGFVDAFNRITKFRSKSL